MVSPNEKNLRLLTTLDEKIALFEQSGIDHLIIYPFTAEFAGLTYEEFVEQILVGQIHTKLLVVGYDDELGVLDELPEHLREPADVRLVERRVELVQQAEGRRHDEVEREEKRHGGKRPLAAGKQRDVLEAGARRLHHDLDPALQDVVGLD